MQLLRLLWIGASLVAGCGGGESMPDTGSGSVGSTAESTSDRPEGTTSSASAGTEEPVPSTTSTTSTTSASEGTSGTSGPGPDTETGTTTGGDDRCPTQPVSGEPCDLEPTTACPGGCQQCAGELWTLDPAVVCRCNVAGIWACDAVDCFACGPGVFSDAACTVPC